MVPSISWGDDGHLGVQLLIEGDARCPRSFHRGGRVEVDDLALHSWARDRRRSSAKLLETSEIPHILSTCAYVVVWVGGLEVWELMVL